MTRDGSTYIAKTLRYEYNAVQMDVSNSLDWLFVVLIQAQAMLLVVVFFAAELIPIYLTLDKRLLAMLSMENYEPLLAGSLTDR